MELKGLKDQAGQAVGIWGAGNQPAKTLVKRSCALKAFLSSKDCEMPLRGEEQPAVVTRGGGDALGGLLGGGRYE